MEEQLNFDKSTMLELRPESIREKQDAYTSLTDLYGVEVFTNKFTEQININNTEELKKAEEVNQIVFSGGYRTAGSDGDRLYKMLFQESISQVLIQDYKSMEKEISFFNVFMVGISLLGVLLLYRILGAGKRGGKRRHAY